MTWIQITLLIFKSRYKHHYTGWWQQPSCWCAKRLLSLIECCKTLHIAAFFKNCDEIELIVHSQGKNVIVEWRQFGGCSVICHRGSLDSDKSITDCFCSQLRLWGMGSGDQFDINRPEYLTWNLHRVAWHFSPKNDWPQKSLTFVYFSYCLPRTIKDFITGETLQEWIWIIWWWSGDDMEWSILVIFEPVQRFPNDCTNTLVSPPPQIPQM